MFKERNSLKASATKIVTGSEPISSNIDEKSIQDSGQSGKRGESSGKRSGECSEQSSNPGDEDPHSKSVASRLKKATPPTINLAGTDKPVEYAGFIRRAFALALDQIIIFGLQWLFFSPALLAILYNESVGWTLTILVTVAATVLQYWIYTACFEHSRWQATPGKFLVGLKVTDLQGNQLSFWRSSFRLLIQYLVLLVLTVAIAFLIGVAVGYCNKKWHTDFPAGNGAVTYTLALYFGYCFVLFTQKKQTLFDKAARRVVVFQSNYANSQQMTVLQCFRASLFKLPQQAKLFFSYFKIKGRFERIRMFLIAAICLLACGWTLFAVVQVTESLVAVECALKSSTNDRVKPKTAIKKMDRVYGALESVASNLNLPGLKREIQDRSLLYSFDSVKMLRRVNDEIDEKQIALAENDLRVLEQTHRDKASYEPDSAELCTRARLALAQGNLTAARDMSLDALKWNPYNRLAIEILNSADSTFGKPYRGLNDVKLVSSLFQDESWLKNRRTFEPLYLDSTPESLEKKLKECNQILGIMPNCTAALIAKADALARKEKLNEAMQCYELAIASDSTTTKPLREYIDFLSNSDKIDAKAGQKKLRQMLKTSDSALVHATLADMLESEAIGIDNEQQEKKLRQTEIEEWNKAIKLDPARILYHVKKGQLLSYMDRYKDAISEFKTALSLDFERERNLDICPSTEVEVRRDLSEAYEKVGEKAKAEEQLSIALEKEPNNEYTLESQAKLMSESKRYKEAIALYTQVISAKKSKIWEKVVGELTTDIFFKVFIPKKPRESSISMQEIYDDDISTLLSERGNAYKAINDHERALADYQEALTIGCISPNDEAAHYCCKLGNIQKAIDMYTAAIAKSPETPHLYLVKYVLLKHAGQTQGLDEAKKHCIANYEKLIAKEPRPVNYYMLAQASLIFEEYSKAESSIKEALKLERDDATDKIMLAQIYAAQKRLPEALKLANSVSSESCSCSAGDKAAVLQACGQYKESLPLLDKSIKEDEKPAKSYYLRSVAYKHEGLADKATADLKKAKELGYDSDPLVRLNI